MDNKTEVENEVKRHAWTMIMDQHFPKLPKGSPDFGPSFNKDMFRFKFIREAFELVSPDISWKEKVNEKGEWLYYDRINNQACARAAAYQAIVDYIGGKVPEMFYASLGRQGRRIKGADYGELDELGTLYKYLVETLELTLENGSYFLNEYTSTPDGSLQLTFDIEEYAAKEREKLYTALFNPNEEAEGKLLHRLQSPSLSTPFRKLVEKKWKEQGFVELAKTAREIRKSLEPAKSTYKSKLTMMPPKRHTTPKKSSPASEESTSFYFSSEDEVLAASSSSSKKRS